MGTLLIKGGFTYGDVIDTEFMYVRESSCFFADIFGTIYPNALK